MTLPDCGSIASIISLLIVVISATYKFVRRIIARNKKK